MVCCLFSKEVTMLFMSFKVGAESRVGHACIIYEVGRLSTILFTVC